MLPGREVKLAYDKTVRPQRHGIENAFGRFMGWGRVAAHYDRCAHIFLPAIWVAAIAIFLGQ